MNEKKTSVKKGTAKQRSTQQKTDAFSYLPTDAAKTMELLGGRSSFPPGTIVKEEKDFILLIKNGIPRKTLDLLMAKTGLSAAEFASVMHTSDRTLRRYKPGKLLNPEQSERVIEIARLYARGAIVFGAMELFKEWMDTGQLVLGNQKPKVFLDTSMGIELLLQELGKIEHGIFA
jgi:putative toxin-antitoxin system antitoxin component (TIGR02293 family)